MMPGRSEKEFDEVAAGEMVDVEVRDEVISAEDVSFCGKSVRGYESLVDSDRGLPGCKRFVPKS